MKRGLLLVCLFTSLLASGCAPSQAELEAEVTQAADDLFALQMQVASVHAEQTA